MILGAGPAGMACAYTLAKHGKSSLIIERDPIPGGLCQTLNFKDYLFDIGGHRFLSKSKEVNSLWHEILEDDLLHVKRLSRIYYRGKYFNYPLSIFNTVKNIGLLESLVCFFSYLKYKYFARIDDNTVEGWITNRFGRRLYEIFFKTYTEKVWGVDCSLLSSKWTAQRIKGLSLRVAIQNALLGLGGGRPKTLADEFLYPSKGPGEFYKRLADKLIKLKSEIDYRKTAVCIRHENRKVISVEMRDETSKQIQEIRPEQLFSTIPLNILVKILSPAPPQEVIMAAEALRFRHFLVVNVILNKEKLFPDQWIYVHTPDVKMGRIQNYKNWSRAMVPDNKMTSLGLEYFCWLEDELWIMKDEDVIRFAIRELEKIGLASQKDLIEGFVVRRSHVYPVYSMNYEKNIKIIRNYLENFLNLKTMGRGGLFRYDNSDHAILTGIFTAEQFLGLKSEDIWAVNTEEEYLER
jgi:protoporphyrinogen oxidase